MTPSSTHGAINFDAPYYLPYVNHGRGGREEEEPDVQYMTEEYKMMSPPIRTEETTGSLPDSGHGTTSVASTGRSISKGKVPEWKYRKTVSTIHFIIL